MTFLFIDHITDLEPGKKITGIKKVTEQDAYLKKSELGCDMLLPCVIGESLGQLAAWCAMHHTDFKLRPLAGIVDCINFYGAAHIGDTITFTSTIDAIDAEKMIYQGIAEIDGKPILSLQNAMGPFLSMDLFIDEQSAKEQFHSIYPSPRPPNNTISSNKVSISFDHITEWEKGRSIIANKTINPSDAYFSDHFPKRPVFPLSLLLHTALELVNVFLSDLNNNSHHKNFMLQSMHDIKMYHFILPGDTVVIKIDALEFSENSIKLRMVSTVNQQRVCTAKMVFTHE